MPLHLSGDQAVTFVSSDYFLLGIENFAVDEATPLEAMNLVAELKRLTKNYETDYS